MTLGGQAKEKELFTNEKMDYLLPIHFRARGM